MLESCSGSVADGDVLFCCFKRCAPGAPSCSRGARCAEDDEYRAAIASAPKCPACHVTCSLYDPQCARGIEFRRRWQAGEEIPERRRPPMDGPFRGRPGSGERGEKAREGHGQRGGRKGPKNTADKLMFLLTGIVPRALGGLDGDDEQRLLSGLMRQDGCMSRDVIAEKTRIDDAKVDQALGSLVDAGLVEPRQCDWETTYYWITQDGAARCEELKAERDRSVNETFSVLNAEEQEALVLLLDKLLAANRPR